MATLSNLPISMYSQCQGDRPVPGGHDDDGDDGDDDGDDEDDEDNLNLPGCVLFNFLQKLTLYREGTPFLPCLLWLEVW